MIYWTKKTIGRVAKARNADLQDLHNTKAAMLVNLDKSQLCLLSKSLVYVCRMGGHVHCRHQCTVISPAISSHNRRLGQP